jgi:hypothetical protein
MEKSPAYRYWHKSGWEQRAAAVVTAMSGAAVRCNDDGSEAAMYDLALSWPDARSRNGSDAEYRSTPEDLVGWHQPSGNTSGKLGASHLDRLPRPGHETASSTHSRGSASRLY